MTIPPPFRVGLELFHNTLLLVAGAVARFVLAVDGEVVRTGGGGGRAAFRKAVGVGFVGRASEFHFRLLQHVDFGLGQLQLHHNMYVSSASPRLPQTICQGKPPL